MARQNQSSNVKLRKQKKYFGIFNARLVHVALGLIQLLLSVLLVKWWGSSFMGTYDIDHITVLRSNDNFTSAVQKQSRSKLGANGTHVYPRVRPIISMASNVRKHPYQEQLDSAFAKLKSKTQNQQFLPNCSSEGTHTYDIMYRGVFWASKHSSATNFQHRGESIHCFLSRVAQRFAPSFITRLRIETSGYDHKSPLTIVPATKLNDKNPLLFPDFTFQSWPEAGYFSVSDAVNSTKYAAVKYGLPGTKEWLTRDDRAAWRGRGDFRNRGVYIEWQKNHSDLLDFQPISYEIDETKNETHMTNRASREGQCRYKFLVHMNGLDEGRYSSALKWKFLCGSLVFLKHKPLFFEWWNTGGVMQPGIHYVPYINPADLQVKIQNYRSNLNESIKIAKAGYELALQAFGYAEEYAHDFILRYAELVTSKDQTVCETNAETSATAKTGDEQTRYKTFDTLKEEYGTEICN